MPCRAEHSWRAPARFRFRVRRAPLFASFARRFLCAAMGEEALHSALGLCLLGAMVVSGAALARGAVAPYGRYAGARSLSMAWGPRVPARIAWAFQELPSLLAPLLCVLAADGPIGAPDAALLAFFCAHYVNRAIVYPLRIRGGKATPAGVVAAAFAFTAANGYLQGRALAPPSSWGRPATRADARFLLGLAVAAAGACGNVWHDGVLRDLRRSGPPGRYGIPRGGLYEYVSGANFLCEIVEWGGFALAARTPAACVFAASCALNVGPRAVHHHRWYLATFGARYPAHRRALVPFLL